MKEQDYNHHVQNIACALRAMICKKTNCGECPLWARMTEIYGDAVVTMSPSCSLFVMQNPDEIFRLLGCSEVIKRLPETWTYCEDALPEEGLICLMSEIKIDDPSWARVEYGSWLDGRWQEIDEWESYPHYEEIAIGWKVVAWMPWPEPAKENPG